MAGVSFDISVDSEEVRRAIAGLITRSLNLKDPFEEIGGSLETSTQQRFEDEQDPEGNPWPELSESYQRKRVTKKNLRGSDHILRERGHLYGSITHLASNTQLEVGSNRVYAAIHQLGGDEGMAPGPGAIPPRPFLGISGDDEREIGRILIDHLERG